MGAGIVAGIGAGMGLVSGWPRHDAGESGHEHISEIVEPLFLAMIRTG